MKTTYLMLLLLFGLGSLTQAQIENPVHWSYGTKVLPDGVVEVHLQAVIDEGWHIYAQHQSADAIAVPTKIMFTKVPGMELVGKTLEIGKMDKYSIPGAGVTNLEYARKVDFIQKVKIVPGTDMIRGKITYQACTHEKCLNEKTIDFCIAIK